MFHAGRHKRATMAPRSRRIRTKTPIIGDGEIAPATAKTDRNAPQLIRTIEVQRPLSLGSIGTCWLGKQKRVPQTSKETDTRTTKSGEPNSKGERFVVHASCKSCDRNEVYRMNLEEHR